MSTTKMRKLHIEDYDVDLRDPEGNKVTKPYRVKDSLAAVLFHPELRLGTKDALKHGKLVDKIEGCKKDSILLTEDEFALVTRSFETTKGFGRNDTPLIERVENCEEVEVDIEEKRDAPAESSGKAGKAGKKE